ncbi:uncharacterized protein L969DRAFT_94644 [Mixia osmundae IAM 14324]|uniref:Nucleotide-diphospho-sugar transferase domain-containing protein n=1 Tax=Mixia osmundae (strain CBS 9802 / IAM 14324 / JCM 22182 / KY 12970) TaxID=764103 RepID=G7DVW7_MIXOS|nr:uncharacterized protein L969DRAFT_94644 [Mixia osmundae IAM 14324]KEI39591.1 hypothetical protein L969DRAFT_94644 [Mixia osmundae IAM 14324]GAA94727.1 hypothetical protein E5Q_01381 [Mixia osmundae IAM 14324]
MLDTLPAPRTELADRFLTARRSAAPRPSTTDASFSPIFGKDRRQRSSLLAAMSTFGKPQIRLLGIVGVLIVLLWATSGQDELLITGMLSEEAREARRQPKTPSKVSQAFDTLSSYNPLRTAPREIARYASYDFTSAIAGGRSSAITLELFLAERVGPPIRTRPIWLTLADGDYLTHSVPHLVVYLNKLASGTLPKAKARTLGEADPVFTAQPEEGKGLQFMLVLCLSDFCMQHSREKGYMAYRYDDTKNQDAAYLKSLILQHLAEAGYPVIFLDGDAFARNDVFQYMYPLDDDTIDLQIQDEHRIGLTNIGFFQQAGNERIAELWRQVVHEVDVNHKWDQDAFNVLLNASASRLDTKDGTRKSRFTSPGGVQTYVLDQKRFWAGHYYHLRGALPPEAILVHMTCTDNKWLKFMIPAAHGYWQDANHYYSQPPKILTTPTLFGTKPVLIQQLRLLLAAAQASGRAFVPPARTIVISDEYPTVPDRTYINPMAPPRDSKAGKLEHAMHMRNFWSVVDIHKVAEDTNVTLLEPNYIMHALANVQPDSPHFSALTHPADFDLSFSKTYAEMIKRLSEAPHVDEPVLNIIDSMRVSELWQLPASIPPLKLCGKIEIEPYCTTLCRPADN